MQVALRAHSQEVTFDADLTISETKCIGTRGTQLKVGSRGRLVLEDSQNFATNSNCHISLNR